MVIYKYPVTPGEFSVVMPATSWHDVEPNWPSDVDEELRAIGIGPNAEISP